MIQTKILVLALHNTTYKILIIDKLSDNPSLKEMISEYLDVNSDWLDIKLLHFEYQPTTVYYTCLVPEVTKLLKTVEWTDINENLSINKELIQKAIRANLH